MLVKDKLLVVWGKAEVKEGNTPKIVVDRVNDSLTRARARASHEVEPVDDPFSDSMWDEMGQNAAALPVPMVAPTAAVEALDDASFSDDGLSEDWSRVPADPPATPQGALAAPEEPDGEGWSPEPVVLPSARAETAAAPAADPPPSNGVREPAAAFDVPIAVAPFVSVPEHQMAINGLTRPGGVLTVMIRRCGDARADMARLEAACQTLREFQGGTPFALVLQNGGQGDTAIDFPNDATRDCAELRERLAAIGVECA